MIIGNGAVAGALKDIQKQNIISDDYIYFASGVSNSASKGDADFRRERQYVDKFHSSCRLIYFSTLSIYYANTPYVQHKINMESIVRNKFSDYTIIRLGNITWGNNLNCMIPYFKELHSKGQAPDIKDVYRYIVSLDEFNHWRGNSTCHKTKEMNVPGERLLVSEIWKRVKNGYY